MFTLGENAFDAKSNGAAFAGDGQPEEVASAGAGIGGKLGELRQHLQANFSRVVFAMMATPRYRHCTLAELEGLALDPLLRGRVAVAQARSKDGAASAEDPVAGIAIWAKVSAEVDAKIREQIKAGVFPVRLKPGDWDSGEIVWLLDVIAANEKVVAAVLANFRQTMKEGQLFVHPIVRGLVDPALLKGRAAAASASSEL